MQREFDIEKIFVDSLSYDEDLFKGMNYKYIKLQTTKECQITSISQIKRVDSLLFVMDVKQHLFLFDLEGNFIRTIGGKGSSNSEYILMSGFFVDKDKQQLGIIDKAQNDYLIFDFSGMFIERKALPKDAVQLISHCELLYDKLIFCNCLYKGHPYNYTIVDLISGSVQDELPFPITTKEAVFGGEGIMCNLGDRLLCRALFSDTIYEYTEKGFNPVYELVTNEPHCTKQDLEKVKDEELYLIHNLNKILNKSIGLTQLYATNSMLFFRYMENGQKKRACYNTKEKQICIEGFYDYRHNIIYSDSVCFISVFDIPEYFEYQDIIELPDELKLLLDKSMDSDNPIIIIIDQNE